MIIAEIEEDILNEDDPDFSYEGKQFDDHSYLMYWIGQNFGEAPEFGDGTLPNDGWPQKRIQFRLYDDDDDLYYAGWMLDDTDGECTIQQFILAWAMGDSGCTRIDVQVTADDGNKKWKTIIG